MGSTIGSRRSPAKPRADAFGDSAFIDVPGEVFRDLIVSIANDLMSADKIMCRLQALGERTCVTNCKPGFLAAAALIKVLSWASRQPSRGPRQRDRSACR